MTPREKAIEELLAAGRADGMVADNDRARAWLRDLRAALALPREEATPPVMPDHLRRDAEAARALFRPVTEQHEVADPDYGFGAGGITEAELAELERLCAEATPGPWEAYANGGRIADARGIPAACADGYSREERDHNRSFIAASRTALPKLVAALRRLRAARVCPACGVTSKREG